MADETAGTGTATGVDADLAAAREALRLAQEREAKANEQLKMAGNLAKNKQQEADNYRRQLQEHQTRREVETAAQNGTQDEMTARIIREQIRQREEFDLLRFKMENPEHAKDMTAIQEIYMDPLQRDSLISTYPDGQPNVYMTLKNASRELGARRYQEMLASSSAEKDKQRDETNRLKAQATISGVSGSVGQETIDVSNMTSDEMIQKGLVQMDERDPVRPRIKPLVRTG